MSIMVRINGSAPMRFMIDTGCAYPVVIDRRVAEKLQLPKTGVTSIIKQGHMPSEEVSVQSIEYVGRLGNAEIECRTADVADLSVVKVIQNDVDGILGMPAFEKVTSQFDLATHTLALYPEEHRPYQPLGCAALKLESADTGLTFVNVGVGKIHARLELDTGSMSTSCPPDVAEAQCPLTHGLSLRTGVDGSFGISDQLVLAELRIGDLVERKVVVDVEQPHDLPLLGINLLSRFRFTLDPRNHLVTLERAADYFDRCRLPGESGITIVRRGHATHVKRVTPKSNAAKAGIRAGDEILSADGVEPRTLTLTQFYEVLDGTEKTTARLRVRHGTSGPRDVQFVRGSEFDGKRDKLYGLMLWKPRAEPIRVVGVTKGTPGGKSGLRPGDVITQIDGQDTARFTAESFAGKYGAKGLRLKVKRPGVPRTLNLRLRAEAEPKH